MLHVCQYWELIAQGPHRPSHLKAKRISSILYDFVKMHMFLITIIFTELQNRQQYAVLNVEKPPETSPINVLKLPRVLHFAERQSLIGAESAHV